MSEVVNPPLGFQRGPYAHGRDLSVGAIAA